MKQKTPCVFFAELPASSEPGQMAAAAEKLWDAMKLDAMVAPGALVALKQHFGEVGGKNFLPPAVACALGRRVAAAGGKPFLTDSNTLYTGRRSNAVDHLTLAFEHGFSQDKLGFPVLIADGLKGESQMTLKPVGGLLKHIFLAGAGFAADAAVILTHVTGHLAAGLGAGIKNVAMGLAGRAGKLQQHHNSTPAFSARKCTACGVCVHHCPASAIRIEKKAVLAPEKCIGCGECFAFCPSGAISFEWSETSPILQRKMAEYCLAFHRSKKGRIAYFNFITRVTRDCDCMIRGSKGALPDLGVVASADPVAADAAAMALLNKREGRDVFAGFWPELDAGIQLEYAEKIGLGSRKYELVRLPGPGLAPGGHAGKKGRSGA